MGKVITLEDRRDTGPYLSAWAICGHCGHGWAAVSPVGKIFGLECPDCGLMAGSITMEIEPEEGLELFTCNYCGGQKYFARKDGCMCARCGVLHSYSAMVED